MTDIGLQMDADDQAAAADANVASVGDYVALLKPRVMSLVVFTALTGLVLAPGHIHPVIGLCSLIAIAIGAGGSGALNMWYDADIDAVMSRTRRRPIPAGRVTPGEALAFGIILSAGSVMVLGLVANAVAAGLLAFTILFYVVIYTMWLKRWTPQNIVIGGAAGALPPVVAWAAVTGSVSLESLVLFAIIFMWTPPHFWALALFKSGDYERAGVPMLPVVAGAAETRRQILLYTLALAPVGLLPWFMGFGHALYGVVALIGGAGMLWLAFAIWLKPADDRPAKRMFGFSILYLFALFASLLVEALAHLAGLGA
ncbi:protoheme IX farnesyltransferase [Labrys wisconsinensis]|uniref:Protoheme IX farnesyltransferase n=2 Tax=Labrys wisconsinensis TaxID=425677 RepID=A0ABU0J811_9HYPH|nr:protoheme IX farnesyltransferase [Labrys wisconsinensis]